MINSRIVTTNLVIDTLIPFFEFAKIYVISVCAGLVTQKLCKLDLMKSLASFHFSILFTLPNEQAASH